MTTPSFSQIIFDAIEKRIDGIHTAMPALITAYDEKFQKADVQPCFMERVEDELIPIPIPTPLPIIQAVPVIFPRTKLSFIHMPVNVGDYVLLIFNEKSIDTFSQIGGLVDHDDMRKHALTDAVALPGFYPFLMPILGVDSNAIQIANTLSQIKLSPDGKIYFSARGSVATELLSPDEPMVLGNTLIKFADTLIESLNNITEALQKNIGVGNMGSPVPASPSLIAELKKIQIELKKNKQIYLDNPLTNITSNHFYGER
ncbi:Gp138 family membrane-puncturing spike protein [Fluviispira vulneris]|uniref:Gp138 family membrane-puncturing spike protein n=1 Tax=Fluviispira vulneris TaxID=2763012 RepID=UPI001644373E|nr:Gp138 family membrane-puncturing spike protein [Fluviispira vulneris]